MSDCRSQVYFGEANVRFLTEAACHDLVRGPGRGQRSLVKGDPQTLFWWLAHSPPSFVSHPALRDELPRTLLSFFIHRGPIVGLWSSSSRSLSPSQPPRRPDFLNSRAPLSPPQCLSLNIFVPSFSFIPYLVKFFNSSGDVRFYISQHPSTSLSRQGPWLSVPISAVNRKPFCSLPSVHYSTTIPFPLRFASQAEFSQTVDGFSQSLFLRWGSERPIPGLPDDHTQATTDPQMDL